MQNKDNRNGKFDSYWLIFIFDNFLFVSFMKMLKLTRFKQNLCLNCF